MFRRTISIFLCFVFLLGILAQIASAQETQPKKKAIIFMAGIFGDQLFDYTSKETLWFPNEIGSPSSPKLKKLELNKDGKTRINPENTPLGIGPGRIVGSKFEENLSYIPEDEFGTIAPSIYPPFTDRPSQKMVESLKKEFSAECSVYFFTYDWRQSRDESANRLKEFIATEGIDDVVLVAHSLGGLVCSAFLKDETNRKKVSKFIAIGSPLLGTPVPLRIMENGNFIGKWFTGAIINQDIVANISHNFSVAYQSLCSPQYTKMFPYINTGNILNGEQMTEVTLNYYNGLQYLNDNKEWWNGGLCQESTDNWNSLFRDTNDISTHYAAGDFKDRTYVIAGYGNETMIGANYNLVNDNNPLSPNSYYKYSEDKRNCGDNLATVCSATLGTVGMPESVNSTNALPRENLFFSKANHGDLISDPGVIESVILIIRDQIQSPFAEGFLKAGNIIRTDELEKLDKNQWKLGAASVVPKYSLDITSVNGTVNKAPNKTSYDSGDIVTLTALPAPGYNFVKWSGDANGSDTTIYVTIDGKKSIIANYEKTISENNLDNWHWRNPLPQGNRLRGVTYGNNTFIEVGDSGTILTSPDGKTWTSQTSGTTGVLYGITHGNNTFVTVGSDGTILTSSDGKTWISRTSGTTGVLEGITYGNNTFVAVGYDYDNDSMLILTSPDGKTWTSRTSSPTEGLYGITYGNNTFVAVGSDGTILTSPDGKIWTSQTSDTTGGIYGITYGNNTFVAVGSGRILTSPNGKTWTSQTSDWLYGITYGNNTFVAVGRYYYNSTYNGKILTSPDGKIWTGQTSGTTEPLIGVTYGNNTFVVVGDNGRILTSPDGKTWTSQKSGRTEILTGITYGNNAFVTVGVYGTILTSPDGKTWTSRTSGTTEGLSGITYGNNTFVAVGGHSYNGTILTSPDGKTWASQISGTVGWLGDVIYENNTFVAVGGYGTILTSPDGKTWTSRTSGTTERLDGITYGNNTFVVGSYGKILTSPDGKTWTCQTLGMSGYLSGVTYGNNTFVMVGWKGEIFTSPDGKIWTSRTSGTENWLYKITYDNNTFVAVGSDGTILSSPNGITWTSRTSGTTEGLSGITYGDNTFVVVGGYGTILQSDPLTESQLTITTTSLISGTAGASYNVTLAASGGTSPYTWSAIGLPAGLSINSSTGVISGTPTSAGTFTITVTVKDSVGQSTSVKLSLNVATQSSAKDITGFIVAKQIGNSTIDITNHTVSFHMANGTSVKSLKPTITVSAGTTINPKSKAAKNFASPVIYTVTAQDGSSQIWTVTCVVDPKSSAKDITGFTVPKQVGNSIIDSTNHTISFHMANGTGIKSLKPTITVSAGSTINPKSKVAKNFASPVIYTVTAQDGTSQTWTVTCIVDPKS